MKHSLQEADRRIRLASPLCESLDDVVDALSREEQLRGVVSLLDEASQTLRDYAVAERKSGKETDARTAKMEAALTSLAGCVAPLLPLLKDDSALAAAWQELTGTLDSGVDLEIDWVRVGKKKSKRISRVSEADYARAMFESLDPSMLAKLVLVALSDEEYHAEIFQMLKERFDT